MPTTTELLDRLHDLLTREAARHGDTVDRLDPNDYRLVEAYPCGRTGVIVFIDHYALTGWEPSDVRRAARDAYKRLGDKLERDGFTLHMVNLRNPESIILTRKLGADFLGMDGDGYIHYRLTLQGFKDAAANKHRGRSNGQEVSPAEGT